MIRKRSRSVRWGAVGKVLLVGNSLAAYPTICRFSDKVELSPNKMGLQSDKMVLAVLQSPNRSRFA